MDDFIKVLIWIIIIISFFSSIFKKKNKGKQKAAQIPHRNPENYSKTTPKVEAQNNSTESKEEIDSYNKMLADIENLFKKDIKYGESVPEKISQPDDTIKTKTSDKTKIEEHEEKKRTVQYDPQWHKETASEHTLIDDWENEEKALEKKAAVDFNSGNKAKIFEETMNQKPEPLGIFKHAIKEKLRHTETLKDYILMSEIIGKPKAKRK